MYLAVDSRLLLSSDGMTRTGIFDIVEEMTWGSVYDEDKCLFSSQKFGV